MRGREKGKEDVGVEKEKEKEEQKGEKMESFFCSLYEFLTDAGKFNATISLCNSLPSAVFVSISSSISSVDTYVFWLFS